MGGSIRCCRSRALQPQQVHHLHPPHLQTSSPSATFLLHRSHVPRLPRLDTQALAMVSVGPHAPHWIVCWGGTGGGGIADGGPIAGGGAGLTSWAVQGIDASPLAGGGSTGFSICC